MVDLRAVVNIEDVDNAGVLVDPIDGAVGAAPGTVTASERPEPRLADPVRVNRGLVTQWGSITGSGLDDFPAGIIAG